MGRDKKPQIQVSNSERGWGWGGMWDQSVSLYLLININDLGAMAMSSVVQSI